MQIKVLHDKSGNILAAHTPLLQGSQNITVCIEPGVDQQVSDIEVPAEHTKLVQAGSFDQLKIQIQGNQHTLVSKK
jgi:hypothetical protein